ncbi:Fic family protein [Limnothrix sp. FACHB-1083]|uniref:Fic family protein n=1 Tax=unclassified Limnothrix TaxID=2632864 RepID=UPI00167FFEBC|nr:MULTISPECIES: Fic family protein [unclassified Limnothrix]MBD2162758.1 Fic family protein [Limnothrix sp. FACHB-1083]MBD2193862.1 Fic family protein [Limnothrix sp. FACHB-1088]
MGRIRTPRTFEQLSAAIPFEQWSPLLPRYGVIDEQGRYLHWNDFQWRVQPGDDAQAAWLATKWSRRVNSDEIPILAAEDDSCFQFCMPNSLLARLHTIDCMTGINAKVGNANVSVHPTEKHSYLVKSLIQEEAITSSQLEGASTTRAAAKEMLEKELAPKDKSQQMILNNYLLMKKVFERRNEPLSIDFIQELHFIATDRAIENQAVPGQFRTDDQIFITDQYQNNVFHPPDWQTIPDRLEELCIFANRDHGVNNLNSFIHPMIKAIMLHFMLAYTHPFGDGNGRTARALFYWSVLRSGYDVFEYISISKFIQSKRGDYDKAFIYTETDDFDLTYFLYNQTETIIKAIQALHDYLERKQREFYEFMGWIDHSPIAKTLKRGHLEILKAAFKQPGREFTAKQTAAEFGISENTARSYLNRLVAQDLLIEARSKVEKSTVYIAPANLPTRLQLTGLP